MMLKMPWVMLMFTAMIGSMQGKEQHGIVLHSEQIVVKVLTAWNKAILILLLYQILKDTIRRFSFIAFC